MLQRMSQCEITNELGILKSLDQLLLDKKKTDKLKIKQKLLKKAI